MGVCLVMSVSGWVMSVDCQLVLFRSVLIVLPDYLHARCYYGSAANLDMFFFMNAKLRQHTEMISDPLRTP